MPSRRERRSSIPSRRSSHLISSHLIPSHPHALAQGEALIHTLEEFVKQQSERITEIDQRVRISERASQLTPQLEADEEGEDGDADPVFSAKVTAA
jgi:hypothetical protein